MRYADVAVSVSRRKLACVLDPALLLTLSYGPLLALRLAQVTEPWLPRAFWQALDASDWLLRPPPPGAPRDGDDAGRTSATAVTAWVALREGSDAGTLPWRWIGDRLAESQLCESADAEIVERYERLAEALGQRWEELAPSVRRLGYAFDPLAAALDSVALSATLDGAPVLCSLPEGAPWPVQALQRLEVRTKGLEPLPAQSLFAAERHQLRDALVSAGLAARLGSDPRLAVVHVCIDEPADADDDDAAGGDAPPALDGPWSRAEGCWYRV